MSVLAGAARALPRAIATRPAVGARHRAHGRRVGEVRTGGITEAEQLARSADAVILVVGEHADMSGEAASRSSIELPGAQLQLAKAVVRAARTSNFDKPVITVLMSGRPLAVQWLADSASALVESWFLGVEHGNALADVLFGDVVPSGKLPATFPRVTGQVPIYYDHKNTGRPGIDRQKYTGNYIDVPVSPLFPFGHGLSYTTFAYANLRVSRDSLRGSTRVVTVDCHTTRHARGDRRWRSSICVRRADGHAAVRELRGFAECCCWRGRPPACAGCWVRMTWRSTIADMQPVVEPGTFTLWAGGSSAATLESSFTVTGDLSSFAAPSPISVAAKAVRGVAGLSPLGMRSMM